jgi:arabinofuranosyltransferase
MRSRLVDTPEIADQPGAYRPLVAIAIGLYAAVLVKTAWLCDDAYITFRTVDNFVSGHGLTWNVAERVQVYTHPLWMLLLAGGYWLTHEVYYTSLVLSMVVSLAAILLFSLRVAAGALSAVVGVAVFALSKSFTDYSTSGLENPLTHLLLVLFLYVYLTRPLDRRSLLWLSLSAALLAVNRMDAILLVLPALCVAFCRVRSLRALGRVVLGFAPFLAWEVFALFYYGSPVPNTAYAKLNTGLPIGDLVHQGLLFLLANVKADPLTAIVIVAGLVIPLVMRWSRCLPVVLGTLLYVVYVLLIGGDFMLGRFLTAPLLIGVVLLSRFNLSARAALLMLIAVALVGVIPPRSPLNGPRDYGSDMNNLIGDDGVSDERAIYYHATGLLATMRGRPPHSLEQDGRRLQAEGPAVVIAKRIGMRGFFAGPQVHIVDRLALADALLARLKPDADAEWRIGHFQRRIPEGYLDTLKTGRNCLADPHLATYYDKLALITRGELLDRQRWLEILKLNLGCYKTLLVDAQP